MRGYLDRVGLRSIAGWALADDSLPELTAWLNGVAIATFRPSLIRSDITHLPRNDIGFEIQLGRMVGPEDVVGVTDAKGQHLARSPRKPSPSEWTREDKALYIVSREMKILEIGPAYSPLASRSRGWNSFSLDHATQEELREKYKGSQPIERIEPVDFVWKKGPIETAIPEQELRTFDVLIASHVLEHIPDPIAFFLSAAKILKPNGLISLVLPDKRFAFDFFKPLTTTSDYLYAHLHRRSRHTKKTAFDNVACNVAESGKIVWGSGAVGSFGFFGEEVLTKAKQAFDEHVEDESGPYVDYHATIYTPSSFALILFELGQMGVIPFRVECAFPTQGCEFFVTLRHRTPARMTIDAVHEERLRLMKGAIREVAQQGRWLLDE